MYFQSVFSGLLAPRDSLELSILLFIELLFSS